MGESRVFVQTGIYAQEALLFSLVREEAFCAIPLDFHAASLSVPLMLWSCLSSLPSQGAAVTDTQQAREIWIE